MRVSRDRLLATPADQWRRGLELIRSACDIVEVLTLLTAGVVAALRQWVSTPWGSTLSGSTPWGSTLWGSTLWGSTLWGSTLWGSAADSNPRPWNDIPGVALVGICIGFGLLIVAIRSMFNKKK
jgi:hypothetical protein